MKILLFGGNGQVGKEIRQRGRELNFEVISPIGSELNITDTSQLAFLTEQVAPDVILNCAAYTAVDKAEEERDLAFQVNDQGTRNVVEAARRNNARLIHLSTDYIFDGATTTPITELQTPHPLNVYGASKLAGENAVREILPERSIIVRTSSVHGRWGNNIVHTILKLLEDRDVLTFVDDQIMSPTWAGWLSEILLDLVRLEYHGVLNACCSGEVSWHGFASEVLAIAQQSKPEWSAKRIDPIPAEKFPRPAKRPAYSVLDTSKLTQVVGRTPMTWQEGLRKHMGELGYE